MTKKLNILLLALIVGLFCFPALAQEDQEAGDEPVAEVDEVIVVTASRTEQKLHDVPAAITVLTAADIENAPADDYGDLLRTVPGLNVSQIGTRDINVSSRAPTASLSTGQLVLVDGRTVYLDFFGFVIWEYLPTNTQEVKQIEIVQGPGSSVWGANAMNGVINVITKSPRELDGTYLMAGGGELDTAYATLTHAGVRDDFSYKVSGTYYQQDEPYDRPTVAPSGTPLPLFVNEGTAQPKFDLRFDWDKEDTTWSFSSGYAGTDGLFHTGIGPFSVNTAALSYVKGSWARRAMNVTAFVNILDGDASNLLSVSPTGAPLLLGFESQTYNVDVTNTSVLGGNHVVTYGANARHNDFDLSLAPDGSNRDELGVFVQDEILIGDKVRWVLGVRVDDIDPVGTVVSPRSTLMFSPNPDHTFRLSFNRAFRSPSLIENHLKTTIINLIEIPPLPPLIPAPIPFFFPTVAKGNPLLDQEQLDAFEVGYVGTFDKSTFTVSVYRNEKKDDVDFFGAVFYSSLNPPPGWPLPPFIPTPFGLLPTVPADTLPELFSYRNIGETVNEGIELSLSVRPSQNWSVNANYSYQNEPEVTGIPLGQSNIPPENRFNFGLAYDTGRFYINGNLNYVDEAFWTDVLDERFFGPTEDFTQVNMSLGWRFNDGRTTVGLIGSNIFDEEVQQHIFGDIISRKISGELRLRW